MKRILYLLKKAKNAYLSGVLKEKLIRYLLNSYKRYLEIPVKYLFLEVDEKRLNLRDGHLDHRGSDEVLLPSQDNISRIIEAYQKAKEEQKSCPEAFEVKGLWAEWITINYGSVIKALSEKNIVFLSSIYQNLFREQCGIGTGGYDEYIRYKSLFGGLYTKYVWSNYKKLLEDIDFDLNNLDFPMAGNPCGVLFNNKVIPIESLRHTYRAHEINLILKDIENPTIAEIGGGLGGLAFQVIYQRPQKDVKFLLFDIPEVLALSSFFLMTALPEKNFRLFGEDKISANGNEDFDIGIFPHFSIGELEDSSIDLFYNSCSFSEMDGKSAKENLKIIERTCRRYFMHDNHDTEFKFIYPDKTSSLNIIGSKLVPNSQLFRRLYKKKRTHGLPEDDSFIHFEYLYEKKYSKNIQES